MTFLQGKVHAYDYEAALDSLDAHLVHKEAYVNAALEDIRHLIKDLGHQNHRSDYVLYERIAERYRHIQVDSALRYLKLGRELAMNDGARHYKDRFDITIAAYMPLTGLVREGIEAYEAINPVQIAESDKALYFRMGHMLYHFAHDYYHEKETKQNMLAKSKQCLDSLVQYIKPNDAEYQFYTGSHKLYDNPELETVTPLIKSLKTANVATFAFARTAATIGLYFLSHPGHEEDAIYFLAVAAISDVMTGNKETTALHRLGKLLHDRGDHNRAFKYLRYSLEDAVESGSRIRCLEVAEAIPIVQGEITQREMLKNTALTIIVAFLTIALIIFVIMAVRNHRIHKRLIEMQRRIISTNDLKDEYIRKILLLCGVYITTLENFNRLVGRKIKIGQVQDLYNMIESGKIIRDQLQVFYDVFDAAFLTIYPTFAAEVNKLCDPEKQIKLENPQKLTPELRILAFMRLGIEETASIAKLLGLTVNTVYTYRNKVKSRALNRENFEDEVKKIGSFT
jgi:DNA-binding CsgD family transcriptional regulator